MADTKYALAPTEPPPSYETAAQSPNPAGAPAKPITRAPLPLNLPALNAIRGKRVILASASPRRKQLLAQVIRLTIPPALQGNSQITSNSRSASQTSKSSPPRCPKTSPSPSPPSNTSSKPPRKRPSLSTPPKRRTLPAASRPYSSPPTPSSSPAPAS